MDLKKNISLFLKRKLLEYNLTSKQLAEKSGIPLQTVNNFRQELKSNPELRSLIKIADFFQCSIDETVGRDLKYFTKKGTLFSFNKKSIDEFTSNLKKFIKNNTVAHNLSLRRLSLNLGLNGDLLANLFHPEPKIKSLSTLSICKLADYFDVSIDEMIGRISYDANQSDYSSNGNTFHIKDQDS